MEEISDPTSPQITKQLVPVKMLYQAIKRMPESDYVLRWVDWMTCDYAQVKARNEEGVPWWLRFI